MARIKKYSPVQNLSNFQVFLVDDTVNSKYFRVNQINDIFTGGKNGFLIEGTPFLRETTEVRIELTDVEGNPIYVNPGDGSPEYYEGLSKLVSVHVYDDTPIGVGKLTILGELKEYENSLGQIVPVPDEWVGAYNVKWQRDILINRNLNNETIVRFFYRPQVTITEFSKPLFEKTIPLITQSGSVVGEPQTPTEGTDLTNWGAGTLYKLTRVDGPTWTSSIDENIISLPSINFSPRIIEVLNDNEVLVDLAYTDANNIVRPFTSTGYTSSFELTQGVSINETATLGSFAKIDIKRLETFVGDVARLKIFRKSRNTAGDFALVQEVKLESVELLKDVTTQTDIETFYGIFSEYNLSTYWESGSDTHPVSINSSVLVDSVKVDYDTVAGGTQTLTTVNEYPLTEGIEYTLSFRTLLSGSVDGTKSLRAYVSSSTSTQTIVSLSGSNDYVTREPISANIISENTADSKLVFEFTGDDWYISNVSFRCASDTAFSPDEFSVVQNVPRKLASEIFDFRFEFYDINNNYIPVDVVASKEFTEGNDLGGGGGTATFLIFESSQNAFRFSSGSLGNPVFQQIQLTTTTSGVSGSVTYASSAFDLGGNYIDPTEYCSQSLYEFIQSVPEYIQTSNERVYSTASINITFDGTYDDSISGPVSISGTLVGLLSGSISGSWTDPDTGTLEGFFSGSSTGTINDTISGSISGSFVGSVNLVIDSSSFSCVYPGLLTNQTSNGGTILISNFTGSSTAYTVGSVLYTASVDTLEEYETIFRLEDGENAPTLIVTSNANQFIYEPTTLTPKPAGQSITIRAQRKNLASLITPITVNSSSLSGNPPPLTFVETDSTRGVDTYSITALEYSASNATGSFPETTYQFSGSDIFGNVYFDEVTLSPVINFDGVSVVLSNETTAFRANSVGVVTNSEFDQGDGTVDVRIGANVIQHSEGLGGANTFDIISVTPSTGLTANNIAPTTNEYGISDMTVDSGSLDLLIRYKAGDNTTTVDFTKKVTYTKARNSTPNVVINGNPITQGVSATNAYTNITSPNDITFTVSEGGTSYSYAASPSNTYEYVITSVTNGTNNGDGTVTPRTPYLSIPKIRSFTSNTAGTGTSISVSEPTGIEPGDLILIIGASEETAFLWAAVSGYTRQVYTNQTGVQLCTYWRRADGTETWPLNITYANSGEYAVAWALRITGAANTNPVFGSLADTTNLSLNINGLTTPEDNCLSIVLYGSENSNVTPASSISSTTSGWAAGANLEFPSNTEAGVGSGWYYKTVESAGSTGTATLNFQLSGAGNNKVGIQFYIRPENPTPTVLATSGSVSINYINSENTTTVGYTQDFYVTVGTDSRRTKTGLLNYQISSSTPPDLPTATLYSFNDNQFTGLTTDWGLGTPTFSGSNQAKYWNCVFDATENTPGAGIATTGLGNLTFSSVNQSIGFAGLVTFDGDDSITNGEGNTLSFGPNGTTTVNGNVVVSGSISSYQYSNPGGTYSTNGTSFDLDTGDLFSEQFYISDGNANFAGAIVGATIDIGGDDNTSFHVNGLGQMWLGRGNNGYNTAPFKVNNDGTLYAIQGTVGGWTLGSTTLTGGSTTLNSDGTLTVSTLVASTAGTIGGWTIGSTNLSNGLVSISTNDGGERGLFIDNSAAAEAVAVHDGTSFRTATLTGTTFTTSPTDPGSTSAQSGPQFGESTPDLASATFSSSLTEARTCSVIGMTESDVNGLLGGTNATDWLDVGSTTFAQTYHWVYLQAMDSAGTTVLGERLVAAGYVNYDGSYSNKVRNLGGASIVFDTSASRRARFQHKVGIVFLASGDSITLKTANWPATVRYANTATARSVEMCQVGFKSTYGFNDFILDTSANANYYLSVEGNSKFTGPMEITSISASVIDVDSISIGELSLRGGVFTVDGDIRATGDIYALSTSDERLKENIIPITGSLDVIKKINGYTFNWNNLSKKYGSKQEIGLIAQEIQDIVPQVVGDKGNGYLGINYDKLVPLLIEGMKEQQKQIEDLKEEIKKIKK